MKNIGTKNEVWNCQATMTAGGLTKADLTTSKTGKVVSRKQQELGKKLYSKYADVLQKNQFPPIK
jgi:hypothetical protein